jgi:hypothetical protein
MKKSVLLTAGVALAGGAAGAVFYTAFAHINDRVVTASGISAAGLFVSILAASVLLPALWMAASAFFIKTFSEDPARSIKETALCFMSPLFGAAGLIPLILLYGKLSKASLLVVGYIYLPFVKYAHVNPAGYTAFTLAAVCVALPAALLLYRYARLVHAAAPANDDKKTAMLLFSGLLAFFAVATTCTTVIYPPTGDEPHYLTISQSMAEDLDINLEDNYVKGRYKAFYPVDIDYKSIHNTADKDGRGIYSLHFPGLPAMITLMQLAGGRFGVQFFMNFVTAALAALFFLFLRKNSIKAGTAAAAAFIIFASCPFSIASSLVMTEAPSALLILYCLYELMHGKKEGAKPLLFCAIAFLPWLHPKMAVFSAVFFAWHYASAISRKSFDAKAEALNWVPLAVSGGIMMAVYYTVFGKFAPFAITSIYKTPGSYFDFRLSHAVKSAVAVFFDRDYGLLVYAPVYITALFGLMYAVIKEGLKRAAPALAALPYFVMFIFWNDWGGSMFPARQLIPILPAAGYYAAYFMQEKNFISKKFFALLAFSSLLISFFLMIMPAFRYLSARLKAYPAIESLKINLLWFLPSFSDIITFRHAITAVYALAILLLFLRYSELKKREK